MLVKLYWSLCGIFMLAVVTTFLTDNYSMFSAVVFGFISFGLVFMGMISVLPIMAAHPTPAKPVKAQPVAVPAFREAPAKAFQVLKSA